MAVTETLADLLLALSCVLRALRIRRSTSAGSTPSSAHV